VLQRTAIADEVTVFEGGLSWTASRNCFCVSRLDAVQPLLGPMQPGWHILWPIDSREN